ncbi:hypothetical protein BOTU111922_08290 [Bordetella tumulicola]
MAQVTAKALRISLSLMMSGISPRDRMWRTRDSGLLKPATKRSAGMPCFAKLAWSELGMKGNQCDNGTPAFWAALSTMSASAGYSLIKAHNVSSPATVSRLISCAANLAVQGGVKSADGKSVRFLVHLVRRLLRLNVLAENGNRCTAAATGEVGWQPSVGSSPKGERGPPCRRTPPVPLIERCNA